ncbi:MAG: imidazole glycerol phosphate synthase subunit HisH [Rhodospirillales bacterium]|nr:imidazole glycerol phosphate synthase subunit HisH [Rhodospirillales bacterium]
MIQPMVSVAIVDYGLANLRSILNALSCFDVTVRLAESGGDLAQADKIVLPGVGAFDKAMEGLRGRGHEAALNEAVQGRGVPFLGICLGLQVLFERSEEGQGRGLGWLAGTVRRFSAAEVKVPHIGWEATEMKPGARLFAGLQNPSDFYFVHSYYAPNEGEAAAAASGVCRYGSGFVAALERDNIFAVQFHPEKSQLAGLRLIQNFLTL